MNAQIEVQKDVCFFRVFECSTIKLVSPHGISLNIFSLISSSCNTEKTLKLMYKKIKF